MYLKTDQQTDRDTDGKIQFEPLIQASLKLKNSKSIFMYFFKFYLIQICKVTHDEMLVKLSYIYYKVFRQNRPDNHVDTLH